MDNFKSIFSAENDYFQIVEIYATKYNLSPALVMGIIAQESGFNPLAKRYEKKYDCYSYGVMQILEVTARENGFKGQNDELFEVNTNLEFGCKYLNKQYNRYDQNIEKAISSYNAGSVTIVNDKFSNQDYVNKVLSYYLFYNAKFIELNEIKANKLCNMILNKQFTKIVNLDFNSITENTIINKDNLLPIILIAIPLIAKIYKRFF